MRATFCVAADLRITSASGQSNCSRCTDLKVVHAIYPSDVTRLHLMFKSGVKDVLIQAFIQEQE
jgi:hypothetical protein